MRATYTLMAIAQAVGGRTLGPAQAVDVAQFGYDTRLINRPAETCFLALKGRRDGHAYAHEAYQKGVRAFWVDHPLDLPADAAQLIAPPVLEGLQSLASLHRAGFAGQLVALAGSNGKTTVKEWLADLLGHPPTLYKSPGSYNSQLGVALSLLQLQPHHQRALIEAGVSQAGEMQRLEALIRPTLGVFVHLGDAHAEGFRSRDHKLAEKASLFRLAQQLVAHTNQPEVLAALQALGKPLLTIGPEPNATWQVHELKTTALGWTFRLRGPGVNPNLDFDLPLPGPVNLENAQRALAAALALGEDPEALAERLLTLRPVHMRQEVVADNPELTLINDAYNADPTSVRNALALLEGMTDQPHRQAILTDLDEQGPNAHQLQHDLLQLAQQRLGPGNVWAIGPISQSLAPKLPGLKAYPTTEALLRELNYDAFTQSTVLLKGARRYRLERLVPFLSRRAGASYVQLDLDALIHNCRAFRAHLPPTTRLLAMVKAAAYGAGAWQMAHALVREGVDYLGVAYTDEGVELRRKGIEAPILVLNAEVNHLRQLVLYRLEPAVWSLELLHALADVHDAFGRVPLPIHLEIDTGMARLGLVPADLPAAANLLAQQPGLTVRSIFTHLAAADDPEADAFTAQQLARFQQAVDALRPVAPNAWTHTMNSAGAARFPSRAGDLVRLGLGLHGLGNHGPLKLRPVASLHSVISQIHHYPAGTPIGYGRGTVLVREGRIATIPIGYADGVPRSLGLGRGEVLVQGRRCPVVGQVCMDMLMVDVTHVPNAQAGQPVVLFGQQNHTSLPLEEVAQAADTIPYELLTRLGPRLRRVYVREG